MRWTNPLSIFLLPALVLAQESFLTERDLSARLQPGDFRTLREIVANNNVFGYRNYSFYGVFSYGTKGTYSLIRAAGQALDYALYSSFDGFSRPQGYPPTLGKADARGCLMVTRKIEVLGRPAPTVTDRDLGGYRTGLPGTYYPRVVGNPTPSSEFTITEPLPHREAERLLSKVETFLDGERSFPVLAAGQEMARCFLRVVEMPYTSSFLADLRKKFDDVPKSNGDRVVFLRPYGTSPGLRFSAVNSENVLNLGGAFAGQIENARLWLKILDDRLVIIWWDASRDVGSYEVAQSFPRNELLEAKSVLNQHLRSCPAK